MQTAAQTCFNFIQSYGTQLIEGKSINGGDQKASRCERITSFVLLFLFVIPAGVFGCLLSTPSLIGKCCCYKNEESATINKINSATEGVLGQNSRKRSSVIEMFLPQLNSSENTVALELELSSVKGQMVEMEQQLTKQAAFVLSQEQELKELKQAKALLESEKLSLQSELQTTQETSITLEKANQEIELKLTAITEKLHVAEAEHNSFKEKAQNSSTHQEQEVSKLRERILEIETKLQEKNEEILKNKESLEQALKEKEQVIKDLRVAKSRREYLEKQHDSDIQEKESMQADLERLGMACSELEKLRSDNQRILQENKELRVLVQKKSQIQAKLSGSETNQELSQLQSLSKSEAEKKLRTLSRQTIGPQSQSEMQGQKLQPLAATNIELVQKCTRLENAANRYQTTVDMLTFGLAGKDEEIRKKDDEIQKLKGKIIRLKEQAQVPKEKTTKN